MHPPVILSYITKLSPKKIVASIMGIYFAAIGLGNKLAGTIGQSSEDFSEKNVFFGNHNNLYYCGLDFNIFKQKNLKNSHMELIIRI